VSFHNATALVAASGSGSRVRISGGDTTTSTSSRWRAPPRPSSSPVRAPPPPPPLGPPDWRTRAGGAREEATGSCRGWRGRGCGGGAPPGSGEVEAVAVGLPPRAPPISCWATSSLALRLASFPRMVRERMSGGRGMKKGERTTRYGGAESCSCKMQNRLQQLLKLLHCASVAHFADATPFAQHRWRRSRGRDVNTCLIILVRS
jgi:hypothetical protein